MVLSHVWMYVLTALGWGVGLYACYSLVTSSVPCVWKKKPVSRAKGEKTPFDNKEYYGSQEGPDRISLLESPVEGLGLRLELFRHVTKTLEVVCHTIHAGGSTFAFFDEIVRAADRGVKVRILLDGKASSIRPEVGVLMRALLTHPNIQCRRYNPLGLLRPWKWHFLMHDKYIIGDGKYLLMGGRNLGDKFFAPDSYGGKVSNDRDVLVWKTVDGRRIRSAVDEALRYFDTVWRHRDVAKLKPTRATAARSAEVLEGLRKQAEAFEKNHPVYFQHSLEQYLLSAMPTRKITFLYNPVEAERKIPWIWQQLQHIAMGAASSVVIQTPYITANQSILSAFSAIAERVNFSILTNSAASTPNFPAYSNYYSHRRRFVGTGARIYEYQNRHSIHGKAMVVDKRLGIVGSFNMDDRSMYLDTEIMLVVDSEEFAGKLQEAIGAYQLQSLCVNQSNAYTVPSGFSEVAVPKYKIPLLRVASVFSKPLRSFI